MTLGEYERLMGNYSTDVDQECGVIFTRSKDLPAVATTWFMAAAYCNALSRAEGLTEEDLVYVEDAAGGVQGMVDDWISRSGYRLPTEAEWEYSARAGAATSRHFGESSTLAGDHAWVVANSALDGRPTIQPVAEKKPNDFGLFDCLGNVFNWCQDEYDQYPVRTDAQGVRDDDANHVFSREARRVMRGQGYTAAAQQLRSASRTNDFPLRRFDNVGFRVARTLYPASAIRSSRGGEGGADRSTHASHD